jgi:hypothetical protein
LALCASVSRASMASTVEFIFWNCFLYGELYYMLRNRERRAYEFRYDLVNRRDAFVHV